MSPREKVAHLLLDLGYKLHEDDIVCTHGGRWKTLNDILECWNLTCESPEGKEVQIYSGYTLTKLQRGLKLVPNTPDSCLYGDLLAVPLNEPS